MVYNISNLNSVHHKIEINATHEANTTIQHLEDANSVINALYIWIAFTIGFPGNVACMATVLTMTSQSTATLYVALLAAVDALALLLKLIFHQLDFHSVSFYNVGCKVSVITYIVNCYANWMLVLVCFERHLAVCWPLKKAVIFTKKRAKNVAMILLAIICLFYTQLFFFYISDRTGQYCGFDDKLKHFVKAWHWMASTVFSILPFGLIAFFTVRIAVGLRKQGHSRKSFLAHSQSKINRRHPEIVNDVQGIALERSFTIMVTVAAIVFLLFTLPSCIHIVSYDPWRSYHPVVEQRWRLINQISHMLADFNHAVNFYLYFLTARKFRSQVKSIACNRWSCIAH